MYYDGKKGCNLIDTYRCTACSSLLEKKSSTFTVTSLRGQNPSDINLSVTLAAYSAGISIGKLYEFFTAVGIVSPTVRNLTNARNTLKVQIKKTSECTLQNNCREHVRAARASPTYPGDVMATVGGTG